MHEMSLAESVIEIVATAAERASAVHVNTIRLEIGELSCVGADALRFCFDAVARGTVAERARLEIIRIPGEGACDACGYRCGLYGFGAAGGLYSRQLPRVLSFFLSARKSFKRDFQAGKCADNAAQNFSSTAIHICYCINYKYHHRRKPNQICTKQVVRLFQE